MLAATDYLHYRWENLLTQRYYICMLEYDLLGDLLFTTVHGGLNSSSGKTRKRAIFSLEEGMMQLKKISKRRQQHGYKLILCGNTFPCVFVPLTPKNFGVLL